MRKERTQPVTMGARLLTLFSDRRTYWVLIILNTLLTLAMVWGQRNARGGDFLAYIGLAQGILHGDYSMWWRLAEPIPDTFRTPGYPLYIAFFLGVFKTWRSMIVAQTLMYALSIHLSFKLIDRFQGGLAAKNIFLFLLLPLPMILYYMPLVSPEMPVILCLSLLLWADPIYKKPTWLAAVGIGLLWGFVFQCRPVFLLFPFLRAGFDLLLARRIIAWDRAGVILVTFMATLLPYGFWNHHYHGKFSLTPLEGGGGVMHIGYWAGRIPNYQEMRYWGNITGDETVIFVPRDSVAANIVAFNREWDSIDAALVPFVTHQDSLMLMMNSVGMPYAVKSYSAGFTLERERLMKEHMLQDIKKDPWYYIKYKLYSTFRLWINMVPRTEFQETDLAGKIKLIALSAISLIMFVGAIVVITMAHRRGVLSIKDTYPLLVLIIYCWLVHVPFVIQTRYTVPVRMALYLYMGLAIAGLLGHRSLKPTREMD
ncbi:MAG: hypothetical protein QM724_00330 [Flavobacteriales bacterium]